MNQVKHLTLSVMLASLVKSLSHISSYSRQRSGKGRQGFCPWLRGYTVYKGGRFLDLMPSLWMQRGQSAEKIVDCVADGAHREPLAECNQ